MAKGRPSRRAADHRKAIELFADAISDIAESPDIETWFATWLHPHVQAGKRDGVAWLMTEYRSPLYAAVRRDARRYVRVLMESSAPVMERARFAFEMVEEAYMGGYLAAVEAQAFGLPRILLDVASETSEVSEDCAGGGAA
ncbi:MULTISPECIES: hypothetical protein [Paraburkholderia]|uniref:hypothetical protein n=1 Tax=Paraburkholderia TaxID=1822464 RepID=UPI003218D14A